MINAIYVVYGHKEEYCGNPPIVVMATASIEDAIREVRQQQNEVALEVILRRILMFVASSIFWMKKHTKRLTNIFY